MQFFKITYFNVAEGNCASFAPSLGAAEAILACVRRTGEADPEHPSAVVRVEIPTDKEGMLRWLNLNCNRENH